jgi:hypothetical protein
MVTRNEHRKVNKHPQNAYLVELLADFGQFFIGELGCHCRK